MRFYTLTGDRAPELQKERDFLRFTEGGAAAVLLYCPNVLAHGKRISLADTSTADNDAVRTFAVGGVIYVPVTLFTEHFGAAFDGAVLSRENRNYPVSGEYRTGGIPAVPVLAAADALGLSAKAYDGGRFAVVGGAEDLAVLDGDAALVHAGMYAMFDEYDASRFTHEDYKKAKDHWRRKLVGTAETNDLSSPAVAAKIGYFERMCEKRMETLNRKSSPDDADPVILWGDAPAVESEDATAQARYINDLARGWAAPGSKFYHNDTLLADILYALDWMYRHLYGQAEIDGTGWRDVHIFNWWDWYVGVPEHLTDIIFLIEEHLTKQQIKQYLAVFEYVYTFMRHRETTGEAMSRICICTKVGLALEEAAYLNREAYDFDILLELNEEGFGPHVDYVDFTHGMPYNMAYGILNLDRELLVASILSGTALAYQSPQMYNQFLLAKYTFEPAMYHGCGFSMFRGRSIGHADLGSGVSVMANLLPMIGVFGEDEDRYIKTMIKSHCKNPEFASSLRGRCSLYDLAVLEDLLRDETIPNDKNYEYAHAYFTGDRAVQHRNNYAVGIAMSSSREPSYESINSANKTGWYTGDGAMYLYTTYDEHAYDGCNFIDNLNIAYRFPGTTEDERERVIRSIRSTEAWNMPTDFAGSVSVKEKYLTAAMDFVSYDFAGPEKDIPDTGYGGGLAIHRNDLHAKKAWFCFDKEIVALGAGITSLMDSPVATTLEHRRIVRDGEFSQSICAGNHTETLPKEPYRSAYNDAAWLSIAGHAGFVFLEKTDIECARYNCGEEYNSANCKGQPYMEFRIRHGENPTDASYAYAVLPYANESALTAYSASPEVTVLSNTPALQAVRKSSLGMTGYAFHERGVCDTLSVDTPCIVMEECSGSIRTVTMTEPTLKAPRVTLTVGGRYRLISQKKYGEPTDCISVVCGEKETVIICDTTRANGRPFEVKLEVIS